MNVSRREDECGEVVGVVVGPRSVPCVPESTGRGEWMVPTAESDIEGQLHDSCETRFYQPDDRGDVLARAVNLQLGKGKPVNVFNGLFMTSLLS